MRSIQKVEKVTLEELGLSVDQYLEMLRKMILIRRFEEKVEELFLVQGRLIGPSHLYLGQEAVAVGVLTGLTVNDLMVTTYRCHGHALAKGVPAKNLMAELFGKATGTCRGLGGSMHAGIYTPVGSVYATAIVGSGIPIAAGLALSLKKSGSRNLVVTFFGDGAVNTGAFHEGMNIAALWRLPLLLVCENNLYAMSTRVEAACSSESIADRAASYNMPVYVVDGNDVLCVHKAAREACSQIRGGGGPVFIEARTYRMKGHGVYDQALYRDKAEVEAWRARDPITLFTKRLLEAGLVSQADVERIEADVRREVEDAVAFSEESPVLPFEETLKLVYVEG
jgi:TPP-dependent pyruvate/acetoin dehydrogenase alpha subunit